MEPINVMWYNQAERMTTCDSVQKEMATQKKEARINQAELDKEAARQHNAMAKQTSTYSTTSEHGHPTGFHQTSAMPSHKTGQPPCNMTEGVVGSYPLGTNRGPGGTTTAHNTHVCGNPLIMGMILGYLHLNNHDYIYHENYFSCFSSFLLIFHRRSFFNFHRRGYIYIYVYIIKGY